MNLTNERNNYALIATVIFLLLGAFGNLSAAANPLSANQTHGLMLKVDGTACAVGRNEYGELGDATAVDRYMPVAVTSLTSATAIATGWYHSLAVKSDGTVLSWGYNGNGELGMAPLTTDQPQCLCQV